MAIDGCEACEAANPTAWMITHLNPAATIMSCEQDIEIALITLIATRMGVDAGALWDAMTKAMEAVLAPEETPDEPEPKILPKRTSTRKRDTKQVEEVTTDAVQEG